MVVVRLKTIGKHETDEKGNFRFDKAGNPIISPDLPEHRFEWRVCEYNEQTNEFIVYTKLVDETEAEKVKDFIDDDFLTEQEQKIATIKQLKLKI